MSEPIRVVKLTDAQYELLRKEILDVDTAGNALANIVEGILKNYAERRRIAFDACRKLASCVEGEEIIINWLSHDIEVVLRPPPKSWKDILDNT